MQRAIIPTFLCGGTCLQERMVKKLFCECKKDLEVRLRNKSAHKFCKTKRKEVYRSWSALGGFSEAAPIEGLLGHETSLLGHWHRRKGFPLRLSAFICQHNRHTSAFCVAHYGLIKKMVVSQISETLTSSCFWGSRDLFARLLLMYIKTGCRTHKLCSIMRPEVSKSPPLSEVIMYIIKSRTPGKKYWLEPDFYM